MEMKQNIFFIIYEQARGIITRSINDHFYRIKKKVRANKAHSFSMTLCGCTLANYAINRMRQTKYIRRLLVSICCTLGFKLFCFS